MSEVVPIHRLSAFRRLYFDYGGGKRKYSAVVVIPQPDGTLTAAPMKPFANVQTPDETFPNAHVEEADRLFGKESAAMRVLPLGGERHRDDFKVKLTQREDGIWAVFCRDEGQPLYDAYNEAAESDNRLFELPEMADPGLYVRKHAEIVSEETITEEVEFDHYGETVTEERPVGVEQEEGRRWFAVQVRVYASTDKEATPKDFIDDVADEVRIKRLTTEEPPKLEYFPEDPTCDCGNRCDTSVVERLDKTQINRCGNCGGTYTTRNKREIAHEPRRRY